MQAKFNPYFDFEVKGNVVKLINSMESGFEFEVVITCIHRKGIDFKINYVKDKSTNVTIRSAKLNKKYSAWISSVLMKALQEGIIRDY